MSGNYIINRTENSTTVYKDGEPLSQSSGTERPSVVFIANRLTDEECEIFQDLLNEYTSILRAIELARERKIERLFNQYVEANKYGVINDEN